MNTVKTIDINAREWWDKVNGNSYFSAKVTVNYQLENESSFIVPFQYGYGNQYEQESFSELRKRKILDDLTGSQTHSLRERGIILRSHIQKGCLKREMFK